MEVNTGVGHVVVVGGDVQQQRKKGKGLRIHLSAPRVARRKVQIIQIPGPLQPLPIGQEAEVDLPLVQLSSGMDVAAVGALGAGRPACGTIPVQ